jgi:Uma2 family endonuclease
MLLPHNIPTNTDELDRAPSAYDGLHISLADFLAFEPEPDGWKLEWENGIITATEETMRGKQIPLSARISDAFARTLAYEQGSRLVAETDCFFDLLGVLRRPDMAFFTKEQLAALERGENSVPTFVIELISPSDQFYRLEKKLFEYFTVGVQTAWYVIPELRMVRVYTSPANATLCMNDDVCSAAPAVPAFQMTANAMFGVNE